MGNMLPRLWRAVTRPLLPPLANREIPSLTGLRGASILLVLTGHLYGTRGCDLPKLSPFIGDYANLGVLVFFVLSGFLITSLLVLERERAGHVSLRAFYWRRTVRIFPPAYAFLAVVAAFGAASAADLLVGVAYLSNMSSGRPWVLGHLWSLAVEEQFYLLWPFAFVRFGLRAELALLVIIALAPLARFATFAVLAETLPIFPAVADSLAVGCLLALRRDWLHDQPWYVRLRDMPASVLLLAMFAANLARFHIFALSYVAPTVLAVLVAALIDRCVVHHSIGFGRMMNTEPLMSIGRLSYSLYLWQQVFLNRYSTEWWTAYPANIMLAFAAAWVSYTCVEKPALRLRGLVSERKSTKLTAPELALSAKT